MQTIRRIEKNTFKKRKLYLGCNDATHSKSGYFTQEIWKNKK